MSSRAAYAAIVIALVALHLFLSRSMDGFLLADGTGYLANARWLVGEANGTWQGPAAFYNVGWSAVVAPVYLLTRDPGTVHASVIAINAVLASLSFVAYAAVGERVLGMRRWHAALAGVVAATYPAVLLQASFEWSESLFHLLFPLHVLALARFLRAATPGSAVVVGALAAALHATHPKGLGVVAAVGIAFAVLAVRDGELRRSCGVGLAALAALFVATRIVHAELQHAIYGETAAAIEGDVLGRITDPALVWGAFRALWGQLWYLTVASLGLAPVGVLRWARVGDRRLALIVLGACAAVLAASCLQMSDGTRVDHTVYGRYNEGFVPVLLVAAVAMLCASRRNAVLLGATGTAIAAVLGAVTVALDGGWRFTGDGDLMPLNVVGILLYRREVNEVEVLTVTALAAAAALAVAAMARWRAVVGAGALVAFFVGSSVAVEARTIRPWEDFWTATTEIPDVIHAIGFEGPVGYDLAAYEVDAADLYQLELTDIGPLLFFDSRRSTHLPGTPLIIASPQWVRDGARLAYVETGPYRQALWVLPGEVQDELDDRGDLVAAEYSAPLSRDARRAAVTVERDGDELVVHVRNQGRVWLPVGAVPGVVQGTVRVGVRWYAGDREVGSATAELPRMLRRGDTATVRVDARPPAGADRGVVALRQEGVAWWDESAVELTAR